MECHHIIPTSAGGIDSFDNMLIVCLEHHKLLHEELEAKGIGHPDSSRLIQYRLDVTGGGKRQ